MHAEVRAPHPLVATLVAALGPEHVLTGAAELEFYSTDVYGSGERPVAVVRPGSTDEVRRIVELALRHGASVVPRGGGASYTDGYVPAERDAVLVDTQRLDRIVHVDERDMYVVVEAGVTWARLHEALAPRGLRTPFFGPFSGLAATVGGSVSQNSISWGSGQYGVSAESVLGVEVVTGTGQVVRTGTWATPGSAPFFRFYGPDLTGLFTGDTGALGVKTRIALRLVRRPREFVGMSFRFATFESMLAGMVAAAGDGLNMINFGLDPALQQGQLGKAGTGEAIEAAKAVYRNARNPVDGLARLARMALAGKRFLSGDVHSVHYVVEGVDRAAARANAAFLRERLIVHGEETANTIPQVVMAMPFAPLYNVLGPRGERWVPVHGILPFSRVEAFRRDLVAYYAANAARMEQHRVTRGAMFMTVGTNGFVYEPVFYWQDARNACHERLVPADYLKTLPAYEPNPAGREVVHEMKRGIVDLFHRHGAAHLQVGKLYPYLRDRDAATVDLLRAVKNSVDPGRRMNPGALGL
jgi:FAD/FMN-containing dehydrogenase